jgi:hypothetical protein
MAFEWLLFWATLRGLRAAGTPVRTLLGDGSLVRGIVLGLLAWPLVILVGMAAKWALGHAGLDVDADTARTVARVGPHGAVEIVLWVLVSLSAGICEEFVFRGYLMRQFAAWFKSWPLGLLAERDRLRHRPCLSGHRAGAHDRRPRDLVRAGGTVDAPARARHDRARSRGHRRGTELAPAQQRGMGEEVVLEIHRPRPRVPAQGVALCARGGSVVQVVLQHLEARTLEQAALEGAAAVGSTAGTAGRASRARARGCRSARSRPA